MTDEVAELQGEALPQGNVEPENTGDAVENEDSATSDERDDSTGERKGNKKPGGFQKKIDTLTARSKEAEERAERLFQQNLELQRALTARQEPKEPEKPAPETTEPKIDDYQSYDEYVSALADYKAEQKVRAILGEQETKRAEAEAAKSREDREREFMSRAESYKAERPDFETVAFNPLLPVTQEMADVINASENGPQVLYHLGRNMAEAQRISNLPPVMQAAELGRIEARITMPQANLNSAAPEPIEPVGGGDGPGVAKHPSEAKDMAEYVRLRNS